MLKEINRIIDGLEASEASYALATVVRVSGSASAKPGSKAVIDAQGRNVYGWVGGGCAETLVREESLQALEERHPRIVFVDLDDEVLGVGMPCGGNMEVYIEPHHPPQKLVIAGHNRLARQLAFLARVFGYAVIVHSPQAEAANFPTVEKVVQGTWDQLAIPHNGKVIVTTDHESQVDALHHALRGEPGYLGFVARRELFGKISKALEKKGHARDALAEVHNPAGLHLGAKNLEEVALSILAEMICLERGRDARPLRVTRGLSPHGIPAKDKSDGNIPLAEKGAPLPEPPELVIVGHGRIAEELARLGVLMQWPVTVNAMEPGKGDFPEAVNIVTGDVDYSRLGITHKSFVVVATLHKGDHLSMQKAMEGQAPYVGLIASKKRSGLVLDYLKERGHLPRDAPQKQAAIFAPAGLDIGATTPAEIALSIMCEMVALHRGGHGGHLSRQDTPALISGKNSGKNSDQGEACRELFD